MPKCKLCGRPFPTKIRIKGKVRNLCKRKYCFTCSPFGEHNTRKLQNVYEEDVKRTCALCKKTFIYNRKGYHGRELCGSCHVILHRKRTKEKAIEYKGGKCLLCGYSKCNRNMIFHHLNPKEKDFNISGTSLSWERIRKELDKCVLLCCRCHGEVEEGLIKLAL